MADLELRANSVRLRFERGSPEPSDADIFGFMRTRMGLKSDKLLSMYKDKTDCSVIIKFKTEEDMRNTLRNLPDTMEFAYNKYESTTVKLSPANAIVRYVRLFNLPPEIEDREIAAVIGKYGKIIRMVREKYGEETGYPIWTTVRGVYLELKDRGEVPALVNVRNIKARVFYEGQVNKCYRCGSADHLKAECSQRKSVNERLGNAGQPSYSGIVANGNRWVKSTTQKVTSGDAGGAGGKADGAGGGAATVAAVGDVAGVGGAGDAGGAGSAGGAEQRSESVGLNTSTSENSGENQSAQKISNMCVTQGQQGNRKTGGEEKSNSQMQEESETPTNTADGDGDAWSVVKGKTKGSGKSSSKRAHKSRNKEQDTQAQQSSDSENNGVASNNGVVSDALDRLTRSKTKQIKLSSTGEKSGAEAPVVVENPNTTKDMSEDKLSEDEMNESMDESISEESI